MHKGIVAEFVGSAIVTLLDKGCFGDGDVATRLERIYDELSCFCKGEGLPLHMTGLTRHLLSFSKDADYPCGTWFKGADTYSVAKWVEHKFRDLDAPSWDEFRRSIYETAKHANDFLGKLYRNGLWLQPLVVGPVIRSGMGFLQEYRVCAQFAYEDNKCRYKIPPKYHAFCHITHTLIEQLGKVGSRELESNLPCVISPLAWNCQLDEDFVGQISALSRTSNLNGAHERVMNLYLLNLPKYW